jgi:predicted RNA binding protein YcfA (HicA-like mRNA interferase family)
MYRAADQRVLTVPMHFAKTVPKGTLRTTIRSAGLGVEEFVRLLKS